MGTRTAGAEENSVVAIFGEHSGAENAISELKADLIVMGVNQAASARASAHLPWAIAHEVVCHAKCPVLTVRS
jgi:nucleotide-binding universal stress UspA family protein